MTECVSVYLFNLRCGASALEREGHCIDPMSKLLIKHINYLFIFKDVKFFCDGCKMYNIFR